MRYPGDTEHIYGPKYCVLKELSKQESIGEYQDSQGILNKRHTEGYCKKRTASERKA